MQSLQLIQTKLGQEVMTAKSTVDKVTPLHLACLEGHVDILEEILARIPRIADALLPMKRDGKSPLYYAVSGAADVGYVAIQRRVKCMELLISELLKYAYENRPESGQILTRLADCLNQVEALHATEFSDTILSCRAVVRILFS